MSATAFRAFSVPEPRLEPGKRLDWALDMARDYFGDAVPETIYVHKQTAAETPPAEGFQLAVRDEVGRYGYWFPTHDAPSPAEPAG